jgi:hypothetical protein
MTTQNSTEYANQVAHPPVEMEANYFYGKLRVYRFTFTQSGVGSAGSIARLVRLPAGKINVIGGLSRVKYSALGTSRTLAIGWAQYRDKTGAIITTSSGGIDAAFAAATAGNATLGSALSDFTKTFESSSGVTLIGTIAGGTIPAAATLAGYFVVAVE